MSDISQFLIPKGFRFGATKAGLKASGRTDFALIVADAPASAAAAFTGNRVKAAPVLVGDGAFARYRRQGARGGDQCGQCQLRRGAGRHRCRARNLRRRRAGVRLQCVGGDSFVNGNHRRAPARRKADCGVAGNLGAHGCGVGSLPGSCRGDHHHRHRGEDGLRARWRSTARRSGSQPRARARE